VCATPLKVLMQLDIKHFIAQIIMLIPTAVVHLVGTGAVDTGEPHIYLSFYNYLLHRSFIKYALLFLSI